MSELLFVYGTLARDAGHPQHRQLAAHAGYVGEGYFHGRLYRVAHYPGAVPSPNPEEKVFGELYSLSDAAALFALLDAYEGCGPADLPPTEFVRQKMPVYLEDGTRSDAWTYLFNRPVTGLARIMSGRFDSE
jgi:gamma-glutamylcyclotransferase (GGCT)/AIG2-like uncharacterized protein YtfP